MTYAWQIVASKSPHIWCIWRHLLWWILQIQWSHHAPLRCYGYMKCAALRHHYATQFKCFSHYNSIFYCFLFWSTSTFNCVMTSNHTTHNCSVKDLWISIPNILRITMTKLSMTCSHQNSDSSNILIVPIMWNGHFIEHYKIKYCMKVHLESYN